MMRVTIKDAMFGELSGEFESEEEARDFYSYELDTFPEDIEIVKVEEVKCTN